jgi:tetratricopeptide (TPR) repeat protein
MPTDLFGFPVTTTSTSALETYNQAAHGLLGWDGATLEMFERAAALDPGLAVAHAGAAVCFFLEERFPEARAAAERARAAAAGATSRERAHVEALALLVGGKTDEAERLMREHLAAHPRDLVVLQRLYFVWFWSGRFREMLEFTAVAVKHSADSSFMLGLHAFALEEGTRFGEAVRTAEAAIALNPRDAWAVHALAHALYDMGDSASGITRLPPAVHPCTHLGWFRNHLLWHLALMHMARGDYERASAMGRSVFEVTPSSIAGDLHDSISLLWRLDLCGIATGDRWQPFAAIARERLTRLGLLFHAVHIGMALAAAGDTVTAERHLGIVRERAPKDRTGLMGDVVVPLLEGMHAFAGRDYQRVIDRIEPLRPRIIEIGGSRAQRDVFHDTLLEACFRAGDLERAERLLAERVARRPDHFWLTRRSRSTGAAARAEALP